MGARVRGGRKYETSELRGVGASSVLRVTEAGLLNVRKRVRKPGQREQVRVRAGTDRNCMNASFSGHIVARDASRREPACASLPRIGVAGGHSVPPSRAHTWHLTRVSKSCSPPGGAGVPGKATRERVSARVRKGRTASRRVRPCDGSAAR